MEEKKSYKADLEHWRPVFFVASMLGVTLLFVAILFIPFKSIGEMLENAFDDYSMELNLKEDEKDDMIAAAIPEQKRQQQETPRINKVEDAKEMVPEDIDPIQQQTEEETETEEEPPMTMYEESEEVRLMVEELPEYPGGMVELMKWLTATLQYPEKALKQRMQGRVMISFIVNKDGTLSDIKIVKSVGKPLDDEALRVVGLMPNWKPGLEKGRPCRTKVAIPIVFEI